MAFIPLIIVCVVVFFIFKKGYLRSLTKDADGNQPESYAEQAVNLIHKSVGAMKIVVAVALWLMWINSFTFHISEHERTFKDADTGKYMTYTRSYTVEENLLKDIRWLGIVAFFFGNVWFTKRCVLEGGKKS